MSASSDHEVVVEEAAVLAADLHARPAGQVTRAATGVDARVWLTDQLGPEYLTMTSSTLSPG